MSTGIEWTDETWNPVTGCAKVSPGCDHCYAKTMHERFNGKGSFDTVTLHPDRLALPLRWRKPRKVFVNSMSDLFHKDVPDDYIAQVFAVMASAPTHTFQILTKRHARMRALLSSPQFVRRVLDHKVGPEWTPVPGAGWAWPLPNVWLGVSVESQQWADIRIPALIGTPAAVRFLSCEPLLGPVDLGGWATSPNDGTTVGLPLDWVIVGGESGPGARPMFPGWARSLRDQCTAAGVSFLYKQAGAWTPGGAGAVYVGDDGTLCPTRGELLCTRYTEPDHLHTLMSRVGKKAAGRELDGRTWDEYPEAVA